MDCKKNGDRLGARRRKATKDLPTTTLALARLNWCCSASECGWPCERMVKGPGKPVYCVDVEAGTQSDLRAMVENRESTCPAGVW